MELKSTGLQLKLMPYLKADAEDWAKVTVNVECNGFRGEFVAWLQSQDVRRFSAELATMYGSVGTPATARLCSPEPDIDVELNMDVRGHIVGSYRFESERRNGTPTVLSGEFEMDQSFIPDLTKQLEALAAQLMRAGL
jgi:hypothetical protein